MTRDKKNVLHAVDNSSELERYLELHPDTAFVDAVFIDLCGIVRGKRYPREQAHKLFSAGLQIPETVYLLDVTGYNADPCGRGFSDGDPDGTARPLPDTLVSVPWAEQSTGQVLMTLFNRDDSVSMVDPRNIAAVVLARFEALGLRPVVAFELEFYLLDPERDAQGCPQPPLVPGTNQREKSVQVYGIDELNGYAAFFKDVESAARAQRVPATVATAEFAPGQYEINLLHSDAPLAAADHCALLRNIVKQVARKHGMSATFMPKPFVEQTGNGMHLHISLLDADGNNVFHSTEESVSATLRHAVGGLLEGLPDSMAVFAPNRNGFRRFEPNQFVPVTKSWAENNRSVACRIPLSDGDARRVEHRVPGADANPYLVLACMLAAIHHGIESKLDPGEPAQGNACAEADPDIPHTWPTALERFHRSPLLRRYLGAEYVDLYYHTKRAEMQAFEQHISAREYDWYL